MVLQSAHADNRLTIFQAHFGQSSQTARVDDAMRIAAQGQQHSRANGLIRVELGELGFQPTLVPRQKIIDLPALQTTGYRQLQSLPPASIRRVIRLALACSRMTSGKTRLPTCKARSSFRRGFAFFRTGVLRSENMIGFYLIRRSCLQQNTAQSVPVELFNPIWFLSARMTIQSDTDCPDPCWNARA